MPIRVHCPNGCLIRMPTNRAGKIVRCPECKSTIELSTVSDSEMKSGKPIPIYATLIATHENTAPDGESTPPSDRSILPASEFVPDTRPEAIESAEQAMGESDSQPRLKSRLTIPDQLSPAGVRSSELQALAVRKAILATVEPLLDIQPIVQVPRTSQIRGRRVKPPALPPAFVLDLAFDKVGENKVLDWQSRVSSSVSDRKVLARFFAVMICFVALINLMPVFLFDSARDLPRETSDWPRWIYLQIFLAALHFIYAILLFQIPDWATLRSVSLAMLGFAFVFGLLSTSLLVEGGDGGFTNFLGLSYSIVQQGAIWCVAMLCLSTLMAFWSGREASHWQRAEQLLIEIFRKT